MPTVCWMHPLIPKAIYSLGRTTTPVCPTWCSYPIHPASTALREAPSDAPISFARCASFANPASPPIPFPPATMICAFCKGTSVLDGKKTGPVASSTGAWTRSDAAPAARLHPDGAGRMFEHPGPHACHLGTVTPAKNLSRQISPEGRSDLFEKPGRRQPKIRTVGCKAGVQLGRPPMLKGNAPRTVAGEKHGIRLELDQRVGNSLRLNAVILTKRNFHGFIRTAGRCWEKLRPPRTAPRYPRRARWSAPERRAPRRASPAALKDNDKSHSSTPLRRREAITSLAGSF